MKKWGKTIGIEEKLDIISRLEKGEQIFDKCHNVRLAHSNIHTIHNKVDRITDCAKSRTKVSVYQVYHSPIGMTRTKNYGCESLVFLLHYKQINILYRNVCVQYTQ